MNKVYIVNKPEEIPSIKKRFILSAFNLMYLSNLSVLHNIDTINWVDGIIGSILVKLKYGKKISSKIPGSIFLKNIIISQKIKKISVLGHCPYPFLIFLRKYGTSVTLSKTLPNFNIKNIDPKILGPLNEYVLISLPSPKQEILAKFIFDNYFDVRQIYCFGGAINMLSNDRYECPALLRNIGLEWLYRLKTDTFRRLFRLIKSLFFLSFELKNIIKIKIYKFNDN